jgi:hypothetical protein
VHFPGVAVRQRVLCFQQSCALMVFWTDWKLSWRSTWYGLSWCRIRPSHLCCCG